MVRKTIFRWLCLGLSALVIGPLIGAVMSMTRGVDGSAGTTALVSSSPVMGFTLVLLGIGMAGVAGIMAAALVGARDGLFCMGLALAWGAWACGRLVGVSRAIGMESPFGRLAVEGLILGIATALVGALVVAIGRGDVEDESGPALGRQSLLGVGAFVVVGGIVGWIIAREGLVGQTFAAAASAGLVGGLAARLVGHGCSSRTLLAGIPLLAFIGPMIAGMRVRGSFGDALYQNEIAGIGWIMPLDWASGILVGLPLGLTWAASMVEHQHGEGEGTRVGAA